MFHNRNLSQISHMTPSNSRCPSRIILRTSTTSCCSSPNPTEPPSTTTRADFNLEEGLAHFPDPHPFSTAACRLVGPCALVQWTLRSLHSVQEDWGPLEGTQRSPWVVHYTQPSEKKSTYYGHSVKFVTKFHTYPITRIRRFPLPGPGRPF